jgi:prophage antirepressor-like protein
MRSDKPEAKPFQDWVTREVLPSIRKTGSYELPKGEAMPLPASISAAFAEAMSGSIRHHIECDNANISTT